VLVQTLLGGASTTNITANNSTSTFRGITLNGKDCSGLTNGGKLTVDSAGAVLCANDVSGGGSATPWASNIDGAGFNLWNVASINGGTTTFSGSTIGSTTVGFIQATSTTASSTFFGLQASSTYFTGLTLAGAFVQASFSDCTGTGNKVVYTGTTGKFGCATDQTGGGGGTTSPLVFISSGLSRQSTTSEQILLGANATTSTAVLEVIKQAGQSIAMYISGFLGIGTTSPQADIHIGSTSPKFAMTDTQASINTGYRTGQIAWKNGEWTIGSTTDNGSASSSYAKLTVSTSTFLGVGVFGGSGTSSFSTGGINLTGGGCFASGGTCLGTMALSGSVGQVQYYSGVNTAVGTSALTITTSGTTTMGFGASTTRIDATTGTSTFWGMVLNGKDCSAGVLKTDSSGAVICGTSAGGTPAGSNGYMQMNVGGVFGANSGIVWDYTSSSTYPKFGIGSSTPWAKFSIVGTSTHPDFAIATSTTAWPYFWVGGIYATNTLMFSGLAQDQIGINFALNGTTTLRDNTYIGGRIVYDTEQVTCPNFGIIGVNITADANNVCGGWAFDIQTDGRLVSASQVNSTSENKWYGITQLDQATPATNDSAVIRIATNYYVATASPVFETKLWADTATTATAWLRIGFADSAWGFAYQGVPVKGCYFEASSTAFTNWKATCKNSSTAVTFVDTGVPTSTPTFTSAPSQAVQAYAPQTFRIEITPALVARFFINNSLVAEINTNVPSSNMSPQIVNTTIASAGSNARRIWIISADAWRMR
jgi:hypothetical protein